MNEKMKQNILNYSNEIKTIENFVDAVRKTVGQYLGYVGNKGYMNMFREIFQNSIDELMKGYSITNTIHIFYDERNHTIIVEDSGRGIPFDKVEVISTKLQSGSKLRKSGGAKSAGENGVGLTAINA